MRQHHFSPGQNIVLRQIWQGRIWSAGPQIVVRDTPELLALYIMPGALCKLPRNLSDGRVKPYCRISGEYVAKDVVWSDFFCLRLKIPGTDYSVEIFRDSDMIFRAWYINMESQFSRIAVGFEYTDEELDIVMKPDLSAWHWKDEDELAEAVALGLITPERAAYLHAEGERVVKWLQSGKSPFNGWENWRPDPSWSVPVLPEGWDKI
jgi:predicted RNA-binding protein associated with RNAse of E/G family